jgi:hypothetical protein
MTIKDVLEKYFAEKVKYFHSSDAHQGIEGDTYLTYTKHGDGRIELYFGGDNGEVCLAVTDNPQKLQILIEAIIYG